MFGSKKKKYPCKFCDSNTEHMKQYNDYFCSKCERFQSEDSVKEPKLLQIYKLKKYNFAAQKYTYIIYNSLGSKIAFAEKRDVTKFVADKKYNIRYYFFNDVNRVIGSVDGHSLASNKASDASWKIYDYGRNLRGEIRHIAESDTWQIHDANGEIIAIRDPEDSKSLKNKMRQFTFVNPDNREEIFFQANRKTGFILQKISDKFDSHIGWGFIVALHQRVYA
ncbi:MAG: hypothetical protein ACTSQK_02570 [Candidatus Heimdallarchaeota archaeon]